MLFQKSVGKCIRDKIRYIVTSGVPQTYKKNKMTEYTSDILIDLLGKDMSGMITDYLIPSKNQVMNQKLALMADLKGMTTKYENGPTNHNARNIYRNFHDKSLYINDNLEEWEHYYGDSRYGGFCEYCRYSPVEKYTAEYMTCEDTCGHIREELDLFPHLKETVFGKELLKKMENAKDDDKIEYKAFIHIGCTLVPTENGKESIQKIKKYTKNKY